ncbi:lipocalin-like domain-containing protein [Hyphomicrobium sp.]|uniref:lipocalin-like domain-containing protein n=1 Tax=Hyphomicrobium sp. TaxID=82 RepID=UPI002E3731B6|nr:lipocalin-like domain-containing protein [Hyphomicrobium sp.]HEX2842839.1 lipocalin-like domain-containing protein [Hyphomicrobium sp.]
MNVRALVFAVLSIVIACFAGRGLAGGFAGLGNDAAGFAEVVPGKRMAFPADFGAHPDYRIEWWYVTANLKDAAGTPYGVQWTLFRQALAPGAEREGFANQQVWMGHAAVTSAETHHFAEALARGGIGQAGVIAEPFKAWVDDWTFADLEGRPGSSSLSAKGDAFSYALTLTTNRAPVPQGEQGYSRKSERGQASYYYSQPYFEVSGTLTLSGRVIDVAGRAWMDREWSSQPLAPDQKGWDWFSLHLDGGEKLMLFQLRGEHDAAFRSGSWIGADGAVTPLAPDDIALTPGPAHDVAGRKIPVSWKVEVKSRRLSIETAPLNPESWMGTAFPYWEGPIRFRGSHVGEGYLEMTGY